MDGINAATGAGVAAGRAAGSGRRLGRSVVNHVARRGATTLEGVVEIHPVTNLVGSGATQVVGSGSAARHGLAEDAAAVEDEVG